MSVSANFIKENFKHITTVKHGEQGLTEIVKGLDDNLYIRKIIPYINLPYISLLNKENSNLVNILYVVEDSNTTYVVEEFLSGKTIKEKLQEGYIFSDEEIKCFAIQLCNGLQFLHQQNILHRDINPANIILLSGNKQIKIIDLSAARYIHNKATDTRLLGTPGYAPPEQYGFSSTDVRSDIYGLGKTMLDLLGNSKNSKLHKIFNHCTELDPKKRYQNITELKSALESTVPINLLNIGLFIFIFFIISCGVTLFFLNKKQSTPTMYDRSSKSISSTTTNISENNTNYVNSIHVGKPIFKQLNTSLTFEKNSYSVYENNSVSAKYKFRPLSNVKPIIRIHNYSDKDIENPVFEFWANHLGINSNNFIYKNSHGDYEYVNLLKRSKNNIPCYLYKISIQGKIPANSDYSIESLSQISEFYGIYTSNQRGRKNILIRAHSKHRIDDLPYEIEFKE